MRLMRCAKARAGVDVRVLVPNGSPERRLTSRARCSGKGQCMSKVPPAQCAIAIWRAAAQARRALDTLRHRRGPLSATNQAGPRLQNRPDQHAWAREREKKMPSRKRTRTSTRNEGTRRSAVAQFARRRPWIVGAAGLVLGALLGSFARLTPDEKQSLREGGRKLKEHATRFKDSVSEMAMDSYLQAKQERESETSADTQIPGGVIHNSLVMADSKL